MPSSARSSSPAHRCSPRSPSTSVPRSSRPTAALDRQALADLVFADPEAVKALNQIVHPAVGVETAERVQAQIGTRSHRRDRHPACWRRARATTCRARSSSTSRSTCRSTGWFASAVSTRPTPGRASPARRPASSGWPGRLRRRQQRLAGRPRTADGAAVDVAAALPHLPDDYDFTARRNRRRRQREQGEDLLVDHLPGGDEPVAQVERRRRTEARHPTDLQVASHSRSIACSITSRNASWPMPRRWWRRSIISRHRNGSAQRGRRLGHHHEADVLAVGLDRPEPRHQPAAGVVGAGGHAPRRTTTGSGDTSRCCQPNVTSRPTVRRLSLGDLDEADGTWRCRSAGSSQAARSSRSRP